MGNSGSSNKITDVGDMVSKEHVDTTPTTEVETTIANIAKIINYHKKLQEVFDKIDESKYIYTIDQKNSLEKDLEKVFEFENSILLTILLNMGVLKTKMNGNDKIVIFKHPSFSLIHKQFINNLIKITNVSSITSSYSKEIVDSGKIKATFEKNLQTMNNVLARILFYKYSLLFNNYLMHIYAIYAQSQFEVFVSRVQTKKKQNEFISIQEMLQQTLKETESTKSKINLNQSLKELNKTIDTTIKIGGSSSDIENNVKNIQQLLERYSEEFKISNEALNTFLGVINKLLETKTKEKLVEYTELIKTTTINPNLINSLKQLETSIKSNNIQIDKNNIDDVILNITNNVNEQKLLKTYLQLFIVQNNAETFSSGLIAQTERSTTPVLNTVQANMTVFNTKPLSENVRNVTNLTNNNAKNNLNLTNVRNVRNVRNVTNDNAKNNLNLTNKNTNVTNTQNNKLIQGGKKLSKRARLYSL